MGTARSNLLNQLKGSFGNVILYEVKRDGIENRKVVSKKHRKTGLKGRLHFIINWKCRCI
mgnify:CR=1 FL=1